MKIVYYPIILHLPSLNLVDQLGHCDLQYLCFVYTLFVYMYLHVGYV